MTAEIFKLSFTLDITAVNSTQLNCYINDLLYKKIYLTCTILLKK